MKTNAADLSGVTDASSCLQPSRKQWIDALRAVAMILVVAGHQLSGCYAYMLFTSPVKLPLFFAVTGYVFNQHRRPLPFLLHLLRRLAIPWLIGGVASVLIRSFFYGTGYLLTGFVNMFKKTALWYLPCCFFAEILWYLGRRYCKKTTAVCVLSMALGIFGLAMARFRILNVMSLNTAFIVQPFILMGFLIRHYREKLSGLKWPTLIALAALYILLGFLSHVIWPGKATINVHANRYVCFPYNLLTILTGILFLFLAAEKLNVSWRPLCLVGRNTLLIYITHLFIIAALKRIYSALGLHMPLWLHVTVTTVITCAVGVVLSVPVNRYLPEAVGRQRMISHR